MKIDQEAINRLLVIDWFKCIAQSGERRDVKYITEKDKLIKHLKSTDWENTTLEAGNEITGFLARKYPSAYQSWNPLVGEYKKILGQQVIPNIPKLNIEDDTLLDTIKWNLISYLMEASYKEKLKAPFFFDEIISIYESGHIPCGWDGQWPSGQLVVY